MYRYDDDDDRPAPTVSGSYKVPDRDFYRKSFAPLPSVTTTLHEHILRPNWRDRRFLQPHYNQLVNLQTPYGNLHDPADGVCLHFLRRGFTKPNKVQLNCALWSGDSRWLVLGTQNGDLALWEAEALKVHKVISIPAHKEFFGDGDRIKEQLPITAMAWKQYGGILATGDSRGVIQYCDETYRNIFVTKDAHTQAVRGMSFSPLDSRLATCSDDGRVHIWHGSRDRPELALLGHQSDVKCIDWHPYRSLIATGSRDTTLKLWDPRQGSSVSTISGHKKQVNCCQWNMNGNWLASGSTDSLIKIYDIRTMKEMEVWRGQNSEVCRLSWHPIHESLLVSGGYNGSIVYWIAGQGLAPHSIIADAHRQSIDLLSWHPSGHLLASASRDCILKFWSRESPGSMLEQAPSEATQDNPPTYMYGPLPPVPAQMRPTTFSGGSGAAVMAAAAASLSSGGVAAAANNSIYGPAGGRNQLAAPVANSTTLAPRSGGPSTGMAASMADSSNYNPQRHHNDDRHRHGDDRSGRRHSGGYDRNSMGGNPPWKRSRE